MLRASARRSARSLLDARLLPISHLFKGIKCQTASASYSTSGSSSKATRPDDGESSIITPWYVSEAIKSSGADAKEASVEVPAIPENSPESLVKIIEFAIQDMGLKDVIVIDSRANDDQYASSALGPALMILGTGSSGKHLGSSAALSRTWLKNEFGLYADREGVLTTNFVKSHNRRQRRRQQRHRTAREDSQLQRVGSWIAIDTKLDNIYVHIMTAERRSEIDLEHLDEWIEDNDINDGDLQKMESSYAEPTHKVSHTATMDTYNGSLGRRSYSTETSPTSTESPFPSSREELALQNLATETYDDLAEDHEVVKTFVDHFPRNPTRDDWKFRSNFFALATVKSPLFSPRRLLEEAELQQASGFVLDNQDVETIISAICYHGQSHFATLSRDDESMAAWSEFTNEKAFLSMRFYDVIMRPQGRALLTNHRLLTLLYRTFTGMCTTSATPTGALESINSNGTHLEGPIEVFMDVDRATPLRYLLETTGEMRNIQTVGMSLTSSCSKDSFDAFWKVCKVATLSEVSSDFAEHVAELAVSLVVRSGDKPQIRYAIQSYLPNSIISGRIGLTPTMVKALNAALKCVDHENNGNYDSVRKIISQYEKSTAQLP